MSNGAIYEDGDYTVAKAITLPVLSAPIPGVAAKYILTQDWCQYAANYTALALGTAYPNTASGGDDAYTSYQLVSEGPFTDLGNGVVKWTRRYALVPATHYDPVQVSYTFPGLLTFNPLETVIRPPLTRSVPGVVEHRYFDAGTNSYSAIQALENTNYVQEQIYYWPQPTSYTVSDFVKRVDSIWENTVPTAATYASWISSGTISIVAQPSAFQRWEGNIVRRDVISILPQ